MKTIFDLAADPQVRLGIAKKAQLAEPTGPKPRKPYPKQRLPRRVGLVTKDWRKEIETAVKIALVGTGYEIEDLISKDKRQPLAMVRHACMRVAMGTGASLKAVGRFFHRDHGTVSYAVKKGAA